MKILRNLRWENLPCITAVCCTVVSLAFCKTETVLQGYVRTYVYVALIPKGVLHTCTCRCTEVILVFMEWLKGSSWKKKKSDFLKSHLTGLLFIQKYYFECGGQFKAMENPKWLQRSHHNNLIKADSMDVSHGVLEGLTCLQIKYC